MPEAPVATEAPAPAAPPPAPANPEPRGFSDLLKDLPSSATKPETPADTGKPADSATPPGPKPQPAKVYAGRFKTPEELEAAYSESSVEGLRLYQEHKAAMQEIQKREAKIAELEDAVKLRDSQPAFRELNKEELDKLYAEDPLKAQDYLVENKLRERDTVTAKEKLKAERETQSRRKAETDTYILKRGESMSKDTENYPDFEALLPDMDGIREKLGKDVEGKDWAIDLIYLASLGRRYLQAHRNGKKSSDEAAKKAAAEAEAAARASRPGGDSPAPNPGGKEDADSDAAVMNRIMAKGRAAFF